METGRVPWVRTLEAFTAKVRVGEKKVDRFALVPEEEPGG